MFEKLKWVYKFLRSRTYVILLDKESAVNIPLMSLDSFESQFMLSAQTASLHQFKSRLEEVIREHEEAIKLLSHRQSVKQKAQTQANSKRKVQKTTPQKRPR